MPLSRMFPVSGGVMKGSGRIFQRWLQDHRTRLLDLLAAWVAVIASAAALSRLDNQVLAGFWRLTPELAPDKVLVWFALVGFVLVIYAQRRWHEISMLLAEAETDVLTGLHNRRKIESLLAHEFDRALRYGRPLSVVMIDVDHFKRINDNFGHGIGDVVLAAIARRVRRRMRISDHFGRWGGEEFLLICPETDTEGAMKIADRMRRTIKQHPMRKAGVVTASFGVSAYSGQGDYDTLIREADSYLYMAKQQGRDRIMSRLVVMTQLRTEGSNVFLEITQPSQHGFSDQLSTLMSTIAAPLRRKR